MAQLEQGVTGVGRRLGGAARQRVDLLRNHARPIDQQQGAKQRFHALLVDLASDKGRDVTQCCLPDGRFGKREMLATALLAEPQSVHDSPPQHRDQVSRQTAAAPDQARIVGGCRPTGPAAGFACAHDDRFDVLPERSNLGVLDRGQAGGQTELDAPDQARDGGSRPPWTVASAVAHPHT